MRKVWIYLFIYCFCLSGTINGSSRQKQNAPVKLLEFGFNPNSPEDSSYLNQRVFHPFMMGLNP